MLGLNLCACITPNAKNKPEEGSATSRETSSRTAEKFESMNMSRTDFVSKKGKRFREYYVIGNPIGDGVGKNGEIRKCKHKKSN